MRPQTRKAWTGLTRQFLLECSSYPHSRKDAAPETADDYLDLAEQASSKKKRLEYLRKALELEPEHVDAQLEMIVHTMEKTPEEQLPALQKLMAAAAEPLEQEGCFKRDMGEFWAVLEPGRICASAIPTSMR